MSLPDVHRSRAVLIGVSAYQTMEPLPGVANNLAALEEVFRSDRVWGLAADSCVVVGDPSANAEMISPIEEAAAEATDTLLVYFAGHGVLHPTTSELRLAHAVTDERQFYSAVPYDDIRHVLNSSRAKRRIVVLDCCFSGRAAGTMGSSAGIADQMGIEGTFILTSSSETVKSLAPPGETYTAFTGVLIEILTKGIDGLPEFLSLDVIFKQAEDLLRERSAPIPQSRDRNNLGSMEFVRNQAFHTETVVPGYGDVDGAVPGDHFDNRRELAKAGVHRPLQAGICGTAEKGGAESIVISGGYPDDEDYGDIIIYTGHGGQNPDTGRQIKDQDPTDRGNRALWQSIATQLPVRVIRGYRGDPEHSPVAGFRYDGLYLVKAGWTEAGREGFQMLRFRLEAKDRKEHEPPDPGRWELVSPHTYRSRAVADKVKRAHDFECQVCGETIETPSGERYAEVVHLKSLPVPHDGPDIPENCLCLCPTDAKRFEFGAITIDDHFQVIDMITIEPFTDLRQTATHTISLEYARYHRASHRLNRRDPDRPSD